MAKDLTKKISDFSSSAIDFTKQNKKYLVSFGAAFVGSYAIGATTSTVLEHFSYSKESIALITLLTRTGSYFAINLPFHYSLHKQDYLKKERNVFHEMKTLGTSNLAGAIMNTILQPSLHWTAMYVKIKNPYAFLFAYLFAGALSTGLKFSIDLRNGIIKNKKNKSLENVISNIVKDAEI